MAAETKTEHGADAASGGLPQFDMTSWSSQIFWLIVTFGILYLVLTYVILPKLGSGIAERGDRIADDLDAASRMNKEAAQASLAYDREMAAAKAKAHNIAETTRKSVDAEIAKEVEAAEAEFDSRQAAADERISKIRQSALAQIDTVASDTAAAIVEKVGQLKPTAAQLKSAFANLKG